MSLRKSCRVKTMSADPNRVAFDRIIASHPRIAGVRPASEVIAGMHSSLILHAAPPTNWSDMSDLMRGGMIGAALFEGIASTPEEVVERAESGDIKFDARRTMEQWLEGLVRLLHLFRS